MTIEEAQAKAVEDKKRGSYDAPCSHDFPDLYQAYDQAWTTYDLAQSEAWD